MRHSHVGFHLIELMTTVLLIAILVGLSLPLYSQYLIHARRMQAVTELTRLALAMEEYHLDHNSYAKVDLEQLRKKSIIADGFYELRIVSAQQNSYVLSAHPLGKQAEKDTSCGALTLNTTGKKGITGEGHIKDCWS